jgi:osmotically-inducible protein OsmY
VPRFALRRTNARTTANKFRFLLPLMLLSMAAAGCSVTSGQESTGEYVDSAGITTKVKTKLATEGGMNLANQVKVETMDDVVQLSGFVPSEKDRSTAEQIAWSVEGVRAVRNNIVVQP